MSSTVPPCIAQLPQPKVQPGPPMVVFCGQFGTLVSVPSMVVSVQCITGTPSNWLDFPSALKIYCDLVLLQ